MVHSLAVTVTLFCLVGCPAAAGHADDQTFGPVSGQAFAALVEKVERMSATIERQAGAPCSVLADPNLT